MCAGIELSHFFTSKQDYENINFTSPVDVLLILVLKYSYVMRPQLLPHKNGHMKGVVVCQGHDRF